MANKIKELRKKKGDYLHLYLVYAAFIKPQYIVFLFIFGTN